MPDAYSEIILPSAARTTLQVAGLRNHRGHDNCLIVLDWTLDPVTADLTPSIDLEDPAGGSDFTLWTAAVAASAVGQFQYLFTPHTLTDMIAVVTEDQTMALPLNCLFKMAVGDTNSATYSVTAHWF
jgi:hypothetical protein